eukprot:CAMPEP_0119134076 /NCGR_PEP_ID=MMETSP1310-20130426/15425_1 /TAXON_ID=464262 /ORGANISM="Genus nov. species nov., Strain RCC2339" /LENGTH=31 /DNA_ID= /DNA_START= /DNA_END= /DNA_ORIENTATION=
MADVEVKEGMPEVAPNGVDLADGVTGEQGGE